MPHPSLTGRASTEQQKSRAAHLHTHVITHFTSTNCRSLGILHLLQQLRRLQLRQILAQSLREQQIAIRRDDQQPENGWLLQELPIAERAPIPMRLVVLPSSGGTFVLTDRDLNR